MKRSEGSKPRREGSLGKKEGSKVIMPRRQA